MRNSIKLSPSQRQISSLASSLFCLVFVLCSPVFGQCPLWVVHGDWIMDQDGTRIFMRLSQNGQDYNLIAGEAVHLVDSEDFFDFNNSRKKRVRGTVDGTIQGDNFNVEIYWPDGLTGVYQGTFRPTGRMEGITFDKKRPSIRANWHSTTLMRCWSTKDTAKAPTNKPITVLKPKPAPAKIIKSTGRSTTTAAATTGVPNLIAFNKPKQTPGTRTLSWDAGPDHPYAELWVKVDDGDETFVVELGKGMREVTVEPGKTYLYILTDSGERLATATVRSQ